MSEATQLPARRDDRALMIALAHGDLAVLHRYGDVLAPAPVAVLVMDLAGDILPSGFGALGRRYLRRRGAAAEQDARQESYTFHGYPPSSSWFQRIRFQSATRNRPRPRRNPAPGSGTGRTACQSMKKVGE